MSFSSETKKELAKVMPEKKCCMLAEIAGFARISGSIRLKGGGKVGVSLTSEDPAIVRTLKKLTSSYFGAETGIEVIEGRTLRPGRSYRLTFMDDVMGGQMLRETGMIKVHEGGNVLVDGIDPELIRKKCCRRAYLRGLFMAGGSVSDPEKEYHLEIVCSDEQTASDIKKLMNQFGLGAKVMQRRGTFVIYIKDSEHIVDFMNITGAHNQLLSFENTRIVKSMRNTANRIVNCESANTDKAVNAAMKQIDNIRYIDEYLGIENLPKKLRSAAELRLSNPELSLSELAGMMDPPVSKSGLNHRFAKIAEQADRLREENASNAKS